VDALIATTAADVSSHSLCDLVIAKRFAFRDKCSGLHDLPDLAETALRHIVLTPRLLHRVVSRWIETFNRDHRLADDICNSDQTLSHRLAVDMYSTGPTQPGAAAVFGSCETEPVADVPQNGHCGIALNRLLLAVY
jgi:hypothetical protein